MPRPDSHQSQDPVSKATEPERDRLQRLIELSGRIQRTMGIARALISGGRSLNLAGIDDGIGILCAQTLDLPQTEAQALLPHLHAVLAQTDRLCLALHHRGEAEERAWHRE